MSNVLSAKTAHNHIITDPPSAGFRRARDLVGGDAMLYSAIWAWSNAMTENHKPDVLIQEDASFGMEGRGCSST